MWILVELVFSICVSVGMICVTSMGAAASANVVKGLIHEFQTGQRPYRY